MGAITLNSVLCGLLYHPVEQHMKRIPITSEKCGVDNKALTLDESSADITQSTEENTKQLSIQSINSSDKTVPREKDPNTNQLDNTEELILQPEKLDNKWCLQLNQNQSIAIEVPMERYRKISRAEDKFTDSTTRITKTIEMSTSQMNEINRENSFFTASAQEKFTSLPIDDAPKSRVPRIFKRLCSKQFARNKTMSDDEKSCEAIFDPEKQQDLPKKKKFFDLSILRDPIYLVILISNSTSAISNTNFMILLPSYAIAEGYDKNSAALLLSIVSALDLIGRIGGASLSDIDFIPKYYYFVGGLGISGIALALLPMFSSYRMLSFFCGLFGISSGTYIGITTVVLADMLGADRLSSSYGIALFVNGVLQLLGPPILGSIYEQTGTYKPIFLALGIILILGTSLWAIVPIVKRRKNKEVEEN